MRGNNFTIQWSKVAANAVDLQKAADSGKNIKSQEIKKQLQEQSNAFKEIKKSLRESNIEIGNLFEYTMIKLRSYCLQ